MEKETKASDDKELFPLGCKVVTAGVQAMMDASAFMLLLVGHSLYRHSRGDWGDITVHNRAQNERAMRDGERILSVYKCTRSPDGVIWIITERDRSVTTVLFPSEY